LLSWFIELNLLKLFNVIDDFKTFLYFIETKHFCLLVILITGILKVLGRNERFTLKINSNIRDGFVV